MSIVNLNNLGDKFKSILENRLVATNVKVKLFVNHKYLYIRDEKLEREEAKAIENNDMVAREGLVKSKKSIIVKDIGNANKDAEITLEYGIRKIDDRMIRPDTLNGMPFQLQIIYTGRNGSKAIRLYTKMQQFTRDRSEAEKNIAVEGIIFTHTSQSVSNHVLKSNINASKYKSEPFNRLISRNNLSPSVQLQNTSFFVKKLSEYQKAEELNDIEEAQQMFSNVFQLKTLEK